MLGRTIFGALAAVLTAAGASGQSYFCDCHDPAMAPCGNGIPTALFGGCINSLGIKGSLFLNGMPSVSTDTFTFDAMPIPAGVLSVLVMGGARTSVVVGDGILCVAPGATGIHRFPPRVASSGNAVSFGPGLAAWSSASLPSAAHVIAGRTFAFQSWYRDPNGPCGGGSNLTNGLGVTFLP